MCGGLLGFADGVFGAQAFNADERNCYNQQLPPIALCAVGHGHGQHRQAEGCNPFLVA